MRAWLIWFLLSCLGGSLGVSAADKTQAKLLLAAETAHPGETIWAAVELKMPPGWHTYWSNPGESGMATAIRWTLPPEVSAGEIQWPAPEKYVAEGLTTYVYHNEVLLLVPLTISKDAGQGSLSIKANVSWLECKETCIPGRQSVEASLAIGSENKRSQYAELIEQWQKKMPQKDPAFVVLGGWAKEPASDARPLLIEIDPKQTVKEADFFPLSGEGYQVGGATERVASSGTKVVLRKQVTKDGDQWPKSLQGLVVLNQQEQGSGKAYQVEIKIEADEPAKSAASPAGTLSQPVGKSITSGGNQSLLKMLFLAFLGGLILNVMPCVLPVIALKILGFVNQGREDASRVRKMGWLYALGVWASFLVLAGFILTVQQAGKAASWGMQFQNPQFLIAMTALVTLVALNLFGVFEITLSGRAMGAAGNLAAKEGAAGAFFNGVLATALATPCTAPALAVALGWAFVQPPVYVIIAFSMVAAGLAAPYVLLSYFPQWLKFLPKPGAWMEKFKQAMGFPMLATAMWLMWLTTLHFEDGTLWIGLFLIGLSLSAWVWGEFVQRGRGRTGVALAMSLLILVATYVFVLEGQLKWRSPAQMARASTNGQIAVGDGIQWQNWDPKAVEAARASGRPVIVDFTANWCLTCKLNKKTSIEIPEVRQKLKEIGAVAFRGDHTHEDPAITAELQRYQRAGVPLVLVFPPEPKAPPIVLPELLTPGIVLEALNKVSGAQVASK